MYNLTNFTSANNILDMSAASNDLTGGLLFTIVLVMVFAISFVTVKNYEMKYALLSSSFITFIMSGVLWTAGLVTENSVVVCLVVVLIALGISIISD